MARTAVNQAGSGPKSVPTPPNRAQFALGTRPPDMYAPRIKPLNSQRQYGKQSAQPPAQVNPLLSGNN